MKQQLPDDSELIEFLKLYRPNVPVSKVDLESQLFVQIERNARLKKESIFWILFGMSLAALIAGYGLNRYSISQQLAKANPAVERFALDNIHGDNRNIEIANADDDFSWNQGLSVLINSDD